MLARFPLGWIEQHSDVSQFEHQQHRQHKLEYVERLLGDSAQRERRADRRRRRSLRRTGSG